MLSETRDMKAAKAFFSSAKAVTAITPTKVTTDGHDSYPRAIRSELGRHVKHRTSRYLTNRLEQDHRGHQRPIPADARVQVRPISGAVLSRLRRTPQLPPPPF